MQEPLSDNNIRDPPDLLPGEEHKLDTYDWPHPLRYRTDDNLEKRRYCSQLGSELIYCEYNGDSLYNEPCYKLSLPLPSFGHHY